MAKLNEKMQSRLDEWRKGVKDPVKKTVAATDSRRGGKGDHGDVLSIEQWEQEHIISQTRR